jgi:hypothetical protein
VKGPTLGLSQQVVQSREQPDPGHEGEGGKQLCQSRDGLVLPDGPGPASKTGRCTYAETSGRTPSSQEPAPNLVDTGRTAVHASDAVCRGDSEAGQVGRWGGHEESLRRTHGEAAGEQLGASPVDRSVSERGNHPGSPSPPPSRGGAGQARGQLMVSGWDGVLVVVRAWESHVHGEGGQHDRSAGIGMSGARR